LYIIGQAEQQKGVVCTSLLIFFWGGGSQRFFHRLPPALRSKATSFLVGAFHCNRGREHSAFYVPLAAFPELACLSISRLKQYSIVNERTILFEHADSIYHIEDFFGLEEQWRMR
jgi:hypothetical protein